MSTHFRAKKHKTTRQGPLKLAAFPAAPTTRRLSPKRESMQLYPMFVTDESRNPGFFEILEASEST